MDFVCKLYGNTYAVHVTVALVGVATLNLALPPRPPVLWCHPDDLYGLCPHHVKITNYSTYKFGIKPMITLIVNKGMSFGRCVQGCTFPCFCRNYCFHEIQIPTFYSIYFQPVLEAFSSVSHTFSGFSLQVSLHPCVSHTDMIIITWKSVTCLELIGALLNCFPHFAV